VSAESDRENLREEMAARKLVTRRFSTVQVSGAEAVKHARRVNRSWITRGNLAQNTEAYLNFLAAQRKEDLYTVCEAAVQAARNASLRQQDPKPYFYASIFSRATREERNQYLKEHFYTRLLSAELQLNPDGTSAEGASPPAGPIPSAPPDQSGAV
jgi:hypothetical protein